MSTPSLYARAYAASKDEHVEALEAMMDRQSLTYVLELLSEVCGAKAEHVASAWQAVGAAKVWERRAGELDRLAAKAVMRSL